MNKHQEVFIDRLRILKLKIRKFLNENVNQTSMVHSTDNTVESIEYITTVFPEQYQNICNAIEKVNVSDETFTPNIIDKLKLFSYRCKKKMLIIGKQCKLRITNFMFGK